MRVAIHNPFKRKCVAETELSQRIYLAASALGWEAAEVGCADEITAFVPDFVLSLHYHAAKLTQYPTYGCMWNPPEFFEKDDTNIRHVFSYDGYLVSGGSIDRWLKHLLYTTPKQYLLAPFFTSCHHIPYHPPNLEQPRLVYFGVNWDGARFQELFAKLDEQAYIDIYGEPSGWHYLKHAYRGTLPCDGVSVLQTLNRAGIGLCLHKEQHRQSGIPSMRIFEIVASGAIAICSPHPFIQEVFGDCVLFIDSDLDATETVHQISKRVEWIEQNRQTALAMSEQAYRIFAERYTLEHLLSGIAEKHRELAQRKGLVLGNTAQLEVRSQPSVQIILRSQNRDWQALQCSLDSLVNQRMQNLSVILVQPDVEGDRELDALLNAYQTKLSIQKIHSQPSSYSSAELWQALNLIEAEYFGVLHSGEQLFPNHSYTLIQLLNRFPDAGVAYSGAVHRVDVVDPNKRVREPVRLRYFQSFELSELLAFNPFIAPNSFLARRHLIQHLPVIDPQLAIADELYLLIYFAAITPFVFSYEVTAQCRQYPYRDADEKQTWIDEIAILQKILVRQDIAPGQAEYLALHTQAEVVRSHTESKALRAELKRLQSRLQDAQTMIAAMESSKFWQLRSQWFKLKQRLGLSRN